jgi:hypothetical protein
MPKKVKFKAHLDPDKKCIFLDGNGSAVIKLTTDESQLVGVIKSFAFLREKTIEVTFKGLQKGFKIARRKKQSKTIR